jgi:hypothetical protein
LYTGDDGRLRVVTLTITAAKRIEMERAMEIYRRTKLVSSSVRRLVQYSGLTRSSGTMEWYMFVCTYWDLGPSCDGATECVAVEESQE